MKKWEHTPEGRSENEEFVICCGGIQPISIPEELESEEEE